MLKKHFFWVKGTHKLSNENSNSFVCTIAILYLYNIENLNRNSLHFVPTANCFEQLQKQIFWHRLSWAEVGLPSSTQLWWTVTATQVSALTVRTWRRCGWIRSTTGQQAAATSPTGPASWIWISTIQTISWVSIARRISLEFERFVFPH